MSTLQNLGVGDLDLCAPPVSSAMTAFTSSMLAELRDAIGEEVR